MHLELKRRSGARAAPPLCVSGMGLSSPLQVNDNSLLARPWVDPGVEPAAGVCARLFELRELAVELKAAADLGSLRNSLTRYYSRWLPGDSAVLCLEGEAGSECGVLGECGLLGADGACLMKHPQVKDALQSEPPLHIPDTLASPELALVRSKLTQDGLARSLLVLPLGEAGRLTGWLVLSSAQAEQFTPLDYHVALLVAAHLSAAVQNLTALRQLSAANARLREQETRLTWLNAQLELLDRTDDLTGLANRRHLMAQLESEFARSRRYGGDLSCLMIDVDGFKQVNDSHGHGGGDLVLKQLGALFRKATRTTDVFGRYGGDEFTLILPHTGTAGALCAAEKLRIAVREHGFTPNDRAPIPLTISVGAATCTDFSSSDAVRLLSLADTALYDAKRAGGDRVRQAGAPA